MPGTQGRRRSGSSSRDVLGPVWVVALANLFMAPFAPAGVAEQQRGVAVDPAQDLLGLLVGQEPAGPRGSGC